MVRGFYVALVLLLVVHAYFSISNGTSAASAQITPLITNPAGSGLITGMATYSGSYFLNWSGINRVTDTNNDPHDIFITNSGNSAVLFWDETGDNIDSAYYTNGIRGSANSELVAGSGRQLYMDNDNVVWADTRSDGKFRIYRGLLSSTKNSLEVPALISSPDAKYCYANITGHCDKTGPDDTHTVFLDVDWRGGDKSDIRGNLTGGDSLGFSGINAVNSPYAFSTSYAIDENSAYIEMAAHVFVDAFGPSICQTPSSGWLLCDDSVIGSTASSIVSISEAMQPIVRVVDNNKYIFWVEKINGKYNLLYTKIHPNGDRIYSNETLYNSFNDISLLSALPNNDKISLWINDGTIKIINVSTTSLATTVEDTGRQDIMTKQSTTLLNNKTLSVFSNSTGAYYTFDGSTVLLDQNGINVSATANNNFVMIAWRWSNGRLFYRLFNITTTVLNDEILNSRANGDVAVAATANGFHLAWIDNTDGFNKIFYSYLSISNSALGCSSSITATCSYLAGNNFTVHAVGTWSGGNFSNMGGNLTAWNSTMKFTSNYTSSPYNVWYNVTGPTTGANFNLSLNTYVYNQVAPGNANMICNSGMTPLYWVQCQKPIYQMTTHSLAHTQANITARMQSLRSDLNSLLNMVMSNATFNAAINNSDALEGLVNITRSINVSTMDTGSSSVVKLTIKYIGSTNVTNFVVYDNLPKTFAATSNDVTEQQTIGSMLITEDDPEYLFSFGSVVPNQTMTVTYTVNSYVGVPISTFSEPYVFAVPQQAATTTTSTAVTTTINTTTTIVTTSIYVETTEIESTITETTMDEDVTPGDNSLLIIVVILAVIGAILFVLKDKIMFYIKYLTA